MNSSPKALGKRLDDLARNETRRVQLHDPSLVSVGSPRRQGRLWLVPAVLAVVAMTAMLVVWQRADSPTSVAAGSGDSASITDRGAAAADGDGDALGEGAGEGAGDGRGAGDGDDDSLGEGSLAGGGAGHAECDLAALVPVLRAGIPTFDDQPAGSFAQLADRSQIVVVGDVAELRRAEATGREYIELVVEHAVDVVTGVARPDVDVIAYGAEWADSSPDPLAEPIAFDGLTVIAFVSPWSGVRGGWAPGVEGLYVGCGFDSPHPAVIENAAGPDDPAEPTVAELQAALGVSATEIARQAAARAAAQAAAPDRAEADETDDEQAVIDAADEAAGAAEDAARAAAQAAAEAEAARVAQEAQDEARREQERIDALGSLAPATLPEARERWQQTQITDYRLYYGESVAGGQGTPAVVDVVAGDIVHAVDGFGAVPNELDHAWTVVGLFDAIEAADVVQDVTFESTLGYPTEVRFDPDATIDGDEVHVHSVELVTSAELAAANARVDAWLASIGPPIDPPTQLIARHERSGENPGALRMLFTRPDFDAFSYRADESVCILVRHKSVDDSSQYTGEDVATCAGTTDFARWALQLTRTPPTGLGYILVVPALDDLEEGWTVSAEVGELEVTEHAALLVVDEEDILPPGPFRITLEFHCSCGDETYVLPFG